MTNTSRHVKVALIVTLGLAAVGWGISADLVPSSTALLRDQDAPQVTADRDDRSGRREVASEVLDWNQIFIDTLIATNTANSSSQRLGAIVHTAIFDAFNGIERRYTPIFVDRKAPTTRRAVRRSSLRRTPRWSACSRRDNRRWTPAMRHRSRR